MVSPLITVEVVDIERFPDLGDKYRVSGVPKWIINDKLEFVGAAPEDTVLAKILSLNKS